MPARGRGHNLAITVSDGPTSKKLVPYKFRSIRLGIEHLTASTYPPDGSNCPFEIVLCRKFSPTLSYSGRSPTGALIQVDIQ